MPCTHGRPWSASATCAQAIVGWLRADRRTTAAARSQSRSHQQSRMPAGRWGRSKTLEQSNEPSRRVQVEARCGSPASVMCRPIMSSSSIMRVEHCSVHGVRPLRVRRSTASRGHGFVRGPRQSDSTALIDRPVRSRYRRPRARPHIYQRPVGDPHSGKATLGRRRPVPRLPAARAGTLRRPIGLVSRLISWSTVTSESSMPSNAEEPVADVAANGVEAIELFDRQQPDFLVDVLGDGAIAAHQVIDHAKDVADVAIVERPVERSRRASARTRRGRYCASSGGPRTGDARSSTSLLPRRGGILRSWFGILAGIRPR